MPMPEIVPLNTPPVRPGHEMALQLSLRLVELLDRRLGKIRTHYGRLRRFVSPLSRTST